MSIRIWKQGALAAVLTSALLGCAQTRPMPAHEMVIRVGQLPFSVDTSTYNEIASTDFILLKKGQGYISLQQSSLAEESASYGMPPEELFQQLYGDMPPANEDILNAKSMLINGSVMQKNISNQKYLAFLFKDRRSTERVFFMPRNQTALMYVLQVKGEPAQPLFEKGI
ncbi:hypothetical protein QCD60_12340 [Pokkaliibacter sp. MBI-7]|uniref:hypothetical protein n=1 Tax=Pokkaliibacter sp. MBI-7 TaxID=3040600 RepID=UPI00244C134E|nr:hypothetical protein [Pokkaliibacter sp. MBI-7]MDH2433360.1 hypothetical protein [Pokkaliibacter sp. MBI-7]